MKRVFAIFLCLTVIFLFPSCSFKVKEFHALDFLGIHVPGFRDKDFRDCYSTVVERDEHGRILYYFEASYAGFYSPTPYDPLTDHRSGYALVVLQAWDEENIYYYDNYFYRVLRDETYSESVVAELKEANDWGQPIDKSLCIKRDLNVSPNFHMEQAEPEDQLYWKDLLKLFCQKVNNGDCEMLDIGLDDWDGIDKCLYRISFLDPEGNLKYYFFITTQNEISHILELEDEDRYVHNDALANLKKECGWGRSAAESTG